MIIYKDITNGDELLSDTFKIVDVGNGLWEVDCKMITKGAENFELEGANPSAEGEDADEGGGEGEVKRVLDIEDQFRLNQLESKPSKKEYQGVMKKYAKAVVTALTEKGEKEKADAFKKGAPEALKKILGNYDNYDIYMGESMGETAMWVLVDFREDGITPYATIWQYGLVEMKV